MDKGIVKVDRRLLNKWRIKSSNFVMGNNKIYAHIHIYIHISSCIYIVCCKSHIRAAKKYIDSFYN